MPEQTMDPEEDVLLGLEDTSTAFESDKIVKLYNCQGFYVRMFNASGDKKYARVSHFPRNEGGIPIKTRHEEFSLYDKNGMERCVVIFPWHRYLKNKHFDENNQGNLFDVEWIGNLECKITYTKKSYRIWLYTLAFVIIYGISLFLCINQ